MDATNAADAALCIKLHRRLLKSLCGRKNSAMSRGYSGGVGRQPRPGKRGVRDAHVAKGARTRPPFQAQFGTNRGRDAQRCAIAVSDDPASGEFSDDRAKGFQYLRTVARCRHPRPQFASQRPHRFDVGLLGGSERLPAVVRTEAMQVEEIVFLTDAQEIQHGLCRRRICRIAVTAHLAFQAQALGAGHEYGESLGDIGRIQIRGDQGQLQGMRDAWIGAPIGSVLVEFFIQLLRQRTAGLHGNRIEGRRIAQGVGAMERGVD